MAGPTTVIVVAQAEGEHATQPEVIVQGDEAHTAAAGEQTHATTEAEGGAHAEVFPPFDGATFANQLFWLVIAFGALYVVLSRLALPRIGGILQTRRVSIEGDLKEAERLRKETDRAITAYEAALAEARKNAHGIAEETRTSIRQDIENKRTAVESDLAKRVAEAETRIQANKQAALANVGAIASETAQALVSKLAGNVTAKQAQDAVAAVTKE